MSWQDLPAWVSAVAGIASAFGVFLAFGQLRLMERLAVTQFEDGLAREYRELCGRLPTKAMLGKELTEEEYRRALDELIHYIDLCNEQIFLRRQQRVSETTWINWREGIQSNLRLPAFAKAWAEVKDCCENFAELRRLEKEDFLSDPKLWNEKTPHSAKA